MAGPGDRHAGLHEPRAGRRAAGSRRARPATSTAWGPRCTSLLTGRPPFEGRDVAEVLREVQRRRVPAAAAGQPAVPRGAGGGLPEGDGARGPRTATPRRGPGRGRRALAGRRAGVGLAGALRAEGTPMAATTSLLVHGRRGGGPGALVGLAATVAVQEGQPGAPRANARDIAHVDRPRPGSACAGRDPSVSHRSRRGRPPRAAVPVPRDKLLKTASTSTGSCRPSSPTPETPTRRRRRPGGRLMPTWPPSPTPSARKGMPSRPSGRPEPSSRG